MILMAALATIASAVFVFEVMQPTSFLSAVRGVEIAGISHEKWDEIYEQLRERLRELPIARNHEAVGFLLNTLIQVERGKKSAAEVLPGAQVALEADGDNWVSRLAFAAVSDLGYGAERKPLERFEAMRQVVNRQPPAKISSLYNDEYTRAWHEVLKKHIQRADVAASAATSLDHFQIVDQYAALPMIQKRIASLAESLRTQGQTAEADACTQWFGRAMLGVIDSDPDAGMRLFASQALGRIVDPNTPISADMSGLRAHYDAGVQAAQADLVDFYFKRPTVGTLEYRKNLISFFLSMGWFAGGCASFFVLLISCVIYAITVGVKRNPRPIAFSVRRQGLALIGFCFFFSFISAGSALFLFNKNGFYSETCVWFRFIISLTVACLSCFFIALFVVPVINLNIEPARKMQLMRRLPVRLIAGFLCLMIPQVFAFLSNSQVAALWRELDLAVRSALYVVVPTALGLILLSAILTRPNIRSLLLVSLIAWMVHVSLGLALLQLHQRSDRQFTDVSARGRMDELSARLGPDWQDQYLKSARAAYDVKP